MLRPTNAYTSSAMTAPANFYADFKGLAELKHAAGQQDPKALREAARQFESIFTQMMLKSMRDASLGESLLDNEQSKFYLEMFDNQLATQLSKGRGLGLAEMMVKQLMATQGNQVNAPSDKPAAAEHSVESTMLPLRVAPNNAPLPIDTTKPTVIAAPATTSKVNAVESIAPCPAPSAPSPVSMTPDEFVRNMWSHAQAAGQELGVDPKTLIAHAALETGWGKSIPCSADGSCSYNLFGIKATGGWRGDSVNVSTLEFEDGIAVRKRENFRAYASPADSFRDYAALLKNNPRYEAALGVGSDAEKFAIALQRGGYATDPNYAQKLTKTALSVAERAMGLFKTVAAQPIASLGRIAVGGKL
jgi:flagellar protein FlgJ